jgi:hypothetical protein
MEGLAVFGGIVLGFILRIGLPIALTFLLGWFLRKLDAKWREEGIDHVAEAVSRAEQDLYFTLWSSAPCWEQNECPPEERIKCKAYQDSNQPCWETFKTNGSLSKSCASCSYREEIMLAANKKRIAKLN